MNTDLIIPILLLAIGAFGVLWISLTLVQAFFPQLRAVLQKRQGQHGERQLARADKLIEQGNFSAATQVLRALFTFTQRCNSPVEVEAHTTTLLSVLSRLISISERRGKHLEGLPLVEELIQSRGEIWEELLKTRGELQSLKKRRLEEGKETPAWALSEFERKLAQLEDRLKTNGRTLQQQFESLVGSFEHGPENGSRTVH